MVKNDKKFCLSHSISQEPYIIWLSFIMQMCKMIISAGVFFFCCCCCFFSILEFWFFGLSEGSKGKKWPKMANISLSHSISQEPCISYDHQSYDCGFWYACAKWWYLQPIFSFFKILILGFFRGGKKAKNDLKLPISVCFALYLRNCRLYHWDFDNDI